MTEMQQVISEDGTRIAYEKVGTGPSLIIVGGALADHHFYTGLASELAQHFTVYNVDRRGHGQSGDTAPYSVEREIEDLNALISEAGEPTFMYGHSAGSALALRAAAAGLSVAKLILADPPYTPRGKDDAVHITQFADETAQVKALWNDGDHKGNAKLFLSGFGLPDEAIEEILDSPTGAGMIHNARALPYDYAVLGDGLVPLEIAASVAIPTLILTSENMPEAGQTLAKVIPNCRYQPLDAPTHELPANTLEPVIVDFFKEN